MPHYFTGGLQQGSHWIGFARFLNEGGVERRRLLERFPSPAAVLDEPTTGPITLWRDAILSDASEQAKRLPLASWIMTLVDDEYSALLAECNDAPPTLFGMGDTSLLSRPAIAIVGTRRPSLDGLRFAQQFAYELARAGFVIVSGLAQGIDAAAHWGALRAGGQTIAVMATGIDAVYPRVNRSLATVIGKEGLLLSQFLPGSVALKHHFPRRNRTISGLSLATLVIEAGSPSGTLITATAATEQGRDVYVLPWSITHSMGQGCLRLLMDGALLALTPADVISGVRWQGLVGVNDPLQTSAVTVKLASANDINDADQELLSLIGDGCHAAEELVSSLEYALPQLLQQLVKLEIKGLLVRESGGYRQRHDRD